MDKYVNHLIKDIEEIIRKRPSEPSGIWDGIDINQNKDDIEKVEEFVYGQKYPLQTILGIPKETLPPPCRLTDELISLLLKPLHELLESHHFQMAYPGNIDDRTKYELLYKEWENEHVKMNFGITGIEFCHYDESECPIPGKCNSCKEWKTKTEEQMLIDSGSVLETEDNIPYVQNKKGLSLELKTEKVKATIENLKPAEGNIAGIFNYCNRWCERCLFTNKCTNYQFEKELGFYDENVDKDKMIEDVNAILSGTLSFLKLKVKEMGIDLEKADDIDELEINPARNHPLALKARDYMVKVSQWLENNFNYFSEIASKLYNLSQKNFRDLNENLEIIGWHMTMIPVKIVRALNPPQDDDEEFYEYDSSATGKLVLECINKSIASFSFLYPKLSKKADEILDFLNILSQIKTGLETELPKAKDFIRPGLDE